MIRISQIKLPISHTEQDLINEICKRLRCKENEFEYKLSKKSIDARKREGLQYIYSVDVRLLKRKEERIKLKSPNLTLIKEEFYQMPVLKAEMESPIIVGAGPAGLFCGLILARAGAKPIILEQGEAIEQRTKTVEEFWNHSKLKLHSNVQFGEGGAGTFSDGKLNTVVKDKYKRQTFVLNTFVEHGAKEEILYLNKPHVGTDALVKIIKSIREEIISLGGQVRFESKVTDFTINQGGITHVTINQTEVLPCSKLVLAIGHSARDTFFLCQKKGLLMIQKSFAIGLRVEHDAKMIQRARYGDSKEAMMLPSADYKVTHQAKNGRGVFSFCMCPGGYVVNASSQEKRLAINGMSYSGRDAKNSNSAIVVTVGPEDFDSDDPLAGVLFQQKWEEAAFYAGGNDFSIPVQRFCDFEAGKASTGMSEFTPCIKGKFTLGKLNDCLPPYVNNAIIEGMNEFGKQIPGFSHPETLLSGVETRTSSPLRIVRDENFQCNIKGIYPCGEGAGYAGGITSAAIDGIKVAEAILQSDSFPFILKESVYTKEKMN